MSGRRGISDSKINEMHAATGIPIVDLMEAYNLIAMVPGDVDKAFEVLVIESQRRNEDIRDLAKWTMTIGLATRNLLSEGYRPPEVISDVIVRLSSVVPDRRTLEQMARTFFRENAGRNPGYIMAQLDTFLTNLQLPKEDPFSSAYCEAWVDVLRMAGARDGVLNMTRLALAPYETATEEAYHRGAEAALDKVREALMVSERDNGDLYVLFGVWKAAEYQRGRGRDMYPGAGYTERIGLPIKEG